MSMNSVLENNRQLHIENIYRKKLSYLFNDKDENLFTIVKVSKAKHMH